MRGDRLVSEFMLVIVGVVVFNHVFSKPGTRLGRARRWGGVMSQGAKQVFLKVFQEAKNFPSSIFADTFCLTN